MGKKHFSDDSADRRGGRSAGGPGGFGNNASRGSSDRGGYGSERGSRGGDRPAYGNGRPASNGAFGRPAAGGAGRSAGGFGGGFGGRKFEGGEKRTYGSSYGGGPRDGGSGFGGGRPFERRDDKPRVGKEQRSGTSYGRTAAPRPERSTSADSRPIREYQPKENWLGQPYRREGEKAVPRGLPGERNRKFQKTNPYEQADDRAPRTSGGSFGRSTPRDTESFDRSEERGPNRPIRAARPFEANPPQPREERSERRSFGAERDAASEADYRADQAAFGRKFTPGAFGRRDGAPGTPRSTGERPGSYDKRGSKERWAPAPGSFAERREALKAQERSVRRSGTAYGSGTDKPRAARPVLDNRADKPKYGEKPGEAPDYKNLKHYEADKNRGNKRRREEDDFGVDETRLNRYIANAGICSRREADALIAAGEIRVNGEVVTEMGYKVQPTDTVQYGKTNLNREKSVYVLLNKPKDFITTTEDPEGRRTVMDLVAGASKERIFPVGRLDRNTTGLLLFTNDGEVAQKLSHPSHKNKKIYQVELNRPLTEDDLGKITAGLELEDGKAVVDDVAVVAGNAHFVGIEIHIGRNRIVRRIFEHLGYEVVALDRVQYAGLTKKDLPRGKWRFLSEQEVIRLKYFL